MACGRSREQRNDALISNLSMGLKREIDDEKIDPVIVSSGLDEFSFGKRPSQSIKKRLQ